MVSLFSRIISLSKWLGDVCQWKNPITYYSSPCPLLHIDLLPRINLPNCVYLHVSDRHMELLVSSLGTLYTWIPKLSWAEAIHPDELDEEFDTFPTSKSQDVVQMRLYFFQFFPLPISSQS
ncbi:C2 calcium/lipid-binding plant phosphoribosyltransferase family protein [Abeliophyllum distichum]|uniref:C2 calcium/lipid-binding plant phosphoribosyltransferase family protein n=1 Tax=Abeliophyllum distichum TaxID=126358 RepID=A0ABD1VYR0_9LAMI